MKQSEIPEHLIAICGMNCHLCLAYKRKKNGCLGCKAEIGARIEYCEKCKIRNCDQAIQGNYSYCFECDSFPCTKIKYIDKRYRTKYGMSMIANLESIRDSGIQAFLLSEEIKYTCPHCGNIVCVHRPQCLHCHTTWRR